MRHERGQLRRIQSRGCEGKGARSQNAEREEIGGQGGGRGYPGILAKSACAGGLVVMSNCQMDQL